MKITIKGLPAELPFPEGNRHTMELDEQLKNDAKQYTTLYHYTDAEALLSMITNREFWLSNLKEVNDQEEIDWVDLDTLKDNFYVASFTYSPIPLKSMWNEYTKNMETGILVSMKKEWFERHLYFIEDGQRVDNPKICINRDEISTALDNCIKAQTIADIPFLMCFGFYAIKYDNHFHPVISTQTLSPGRDDAYIGVHTPMGIGIVKKTAGTCRRPGKEEYEKNWAEEKEVRLRVMLTNEYGAEKFLVYRKRIAVKLADNAFDDFSLVFSPYYCGARKNMFIKKLHYLLPSSTIKIS